MSEKRRALGRGLGALIPNAPTSPNGRPVDVFFPDSRPGAATAYAGGSPAGADDQDGGRRRDADPDADGRRRAATRRRLAAPTPADADRGRPTRRAEARRLASLAPVPGVSYGEIPVEQIRPNPRQPRSVFDEDDMAELVHSIREIGVLQPIVIRPIPAGQGPDELDNAGRTACATS